MLSRIERRSFSKKLLIAAVPLALALYILLYPGLSARSIDTSVLTLIVLAVVIVIVPWEHMTSLKAGGVVEVALDNPRVQNAVEVLRMKQDVSDEKLRAVLQRFEVEIEHVRGSRILWIDHEPWNILGERRLFRALGMEIVMAASSALAREHLTLDGDFDLIISDVRRGRGKFPEGIYFIKAYFDEETRHRSGADYSHIPKVPVIFYSGDTTGKLQRLTQSLEASGVDVLIAHGVEQLLHKSLASLYRVRREPIAIVQNPEQTRKLTSTADVGPTGR